MESIFKMNCNFCKREFSSQGQLIRHERTHTGEKPYVCPYPNCKKRFSRTDNMNQHYKCHLSSGYIAERQKDYESRGNIFVFHLEDLFEQTRQENQKNQLKISCSLESRVPKSISSPYDFGKDNQDHVSLCSSSSSLSSPFTTEASPLESFKVNPSSNSQSLLAFASSSSSSSSSPPSSSTSVYKVKSFEGKARKRQPNKTNGLNKRQTKIYKTKSEKTRISFLTHEQHQQDDNNITTLTNNHVNLTCFNQTYSLPSLKDVFPSYITTLTP